jgi:hypothetical protein
MPDLERILQNTPGTLQQQWYEDGEPVDPGTVTVGITRADGTELVASGTATAGSGANPRAYSLTASQTALLDTLTVTWTSTTKGTLVSVLEVVGGFVFTVAEARAMKPFSDTLNDGTYRISTDQIIATRIEVERALEHELGFAMVPRYEIETFDGDSGNALMLRWPYVRAVRAATVTGSALDAGALASLSMSVTGRVYYPSGWASGQQNVVIGYEHGLGVPPAGGKQVALALLKRWLAGAPADDRATTMSTNEQTTTFYVPGASEPFDVPAANRFVQSHCLRTGIA